MAERPCEGSGRSRALDAAIELAEEAVRIIEPSDFLNPRAEAHMDMAHVLNRAGRNAEALGAVEHAADLYERKGNRIAADKARSAARDLAGSVRAKLPRARP